MVKKALESPAADAPLPVIGFPETILSVDASLLELIRKWEEVSPLKGSTTPPIPSEWMGLADEM